MLRTVPVSGYTKQDGTFVRAHTRNIGGAAVAGGGGLFLAFLLLAGLNHAARPLDPNHPPQPAPTVTVRIGTP